MTQQTVPFSTFSLHLTEHLHDLRSDTQTTTHEDATFLDLTGNGSYSPSRPGLPISLLGVNHISCGTFTLSTENRINFTLMVNADFPPDHIWKLQLPGNVTILGIPLIKGELIEQAQYLVQGLRLNLLITPPLEILDKFAKIMHRFHLVMLLENPKMPPATILHFDSPESLLKNEQNVHIFKLMNLLR